MIRKIGFRNVLRNKRRSLMTSLIMGLGLASLIFADAFLRGLNENMITSVTDSFLGDGQIHNKDFLQTRDLGKTINNPDNLITSLSQSSHIKLFSKRTTSNGIISSATDVLPVVMYGIDPDVENKVTGIKSNLISGDYLSEDNLDQIMIGDRLANFLEVKVGDKIVLTTSQAQTGSIAQDLYRIGGIFKFKNKEMDSSLVFLHIKKHMEKIAITNSFHEIVFKFNQRKDVIDPPEIILTKFSQNGNEAVSWKKLMPAIDAGIQLTSYSLYIGSIILFAIIALSTMNTLFMSLYERMYEFGIMKAIGTRPSFILKLIIWEAASLSIMSAIGGIILGGTVTVITNKLGINHLTDVEYLGTTIKTAIRPVIMSDQYLIYPLAIIIFALIASIYPAITAMKIIPSQSIRRD